MMVLADAAAMMLMQMLMRGLSLLWLADGRRCCGSATRIAGRGVGDSARGGCIIVCCAFG